MKWDDLQFVLAVEREGGLAAASRSLGINYSTAHRRLLRMERSLGMRIFNRRRDGYHLTPMAGELSQAARRIEAEVLALERQVSGADMRLGGTVRVSTSQLMGIYVLPGMFERFAARYPGVGVDVSVTDDLANLNRCDADVVIRATAKPPPYLSGLDSGPVTYAAYVHHSLAARGRPLSGYPWIDFAGADPGAPLSRWRQEIVPGAACSYRFDSAAAIHGAVAAGLGAAVLPCLVGETQAGFTRISEVRQQPGFDLWILTHSDLRKSARIRTFMRFIGAQTEGFLRGLPRQRRGAGEERRSAATGVA
jgi:DNA-binding transcriptional LysR family regulator